MPAHLNHGQINGQLTDLPTTEQQSDSYIPYFKLRLRGYTKGSMP